MKTRRRSCGRSEFLSIYRLITVCILELVRDVMRKRHFRPVKTENIEEHKMHSEHYHLPKETADLINETHNNGGRVVAVGTTCCRTLESVATYCGEICEKDDWTSIFIYPGYKFKCIDALITNFHLPESTLIMLVSAFYNRDDILKAYEEAVKEKYRFFSFGDCMLIV